MYGNTIDLSAWDAARGRSDCTDCVGGAFYSWNENWLQMAQNALAYSGSAAIDSPSISHEWDL